jgi:hypothetical protein
MNARRLPVALLVALGACASTGSGAATAPSGPVRGNGPLLVGTWELVSTRVSRGDSSFAEERAPTIRALKVLNGTHYSLVTLRSGVFARAATGRYRVVGDSYSETIELASGRFVEGRTYNFRIHVDGDEWTTDGGMGAEQYHEVWRRLR